MKWQSAIGFTLLALGGSWLGAQGQKAAVIRAGQLFDGKSDRLLSNQVIVIQGDRIAEVGPAGSITIPAGAQEIDLRSATVLPGLIEGHNHMFKVGDHPGAGADASVPLVIEPGTPRPHRPRTAGLPARLAAHARRDRPEHEGARARPRGRERVQRDHRRPRRRHARPAADAGGDGGSAGIDRRTPLLPPRGLAI